MALSDYTTALVTGASSGIGEAVVRALTAKGLTVHAAARRQDRLDGLAEATGCITHEVDVRDRDAIYEAFGGIEADILVNNAGLGRFTNFAEVDPDEIDLTIATNVAGAMHVARSVVAGMKARGRGHIVNLGSVAGLYPVNSVAYGGSKGAVHLMSQNMRIELAGTGIRVTEICPGRVGTEIFDTAITDDAARAAFTQGYEILQPGDIADAIVYALDTPWRVNVAMIEITPTEQSLGGGTITPAK